MYKTPCLILLTRPYTNPVRNVFVLFLHLKHLETGGVTLRGFEPKSVSNTSIVAS